MWDWLKADSRLFLDIKPNSLNYLQGSSPCVKWKPESQDARPCSWKEKKLAMFLMLSPETPAHMLSDSYAPSSFFFFLKLKSYKCKILSSSTHFTEYIYAVLRQKMIGAVLRRGQNCPLTQTNQSPPCGCILASSAYIPAIAPMPKRNAKVDATSNKAKVNFCRVIC